MTEAKPPTSRDRQREHTRQRLFEAAIAEFKREGIDKARIERICKAAGVAKGCRICECTVAAVLHGRLRPEWVDYRPKVTPPRTTAFENRGQSGPGRFTC